MPQMMPLNWLNLFFLTIFMILFINSLNYFSFMYLPKMKFKNKKNNIFWKW